MRAQLRQLARWLRLALACLAVGSAVSPAQVASAAEPAGVVQGGAGNKPVAVVSVRQTPRHGSACFITGAPRTFPVGLVRATEPRARQALFLLHRALLR